MRNLNNYLMILLFAIISIMSCKKSTDSATSNLTPTNLQVYASASVDGTGIVGVTATADNAVSYIINYGNGDSVTVNSGIANYQYTLSGTNTYTITVTAVSSTGLSVQQAVNVGVYVKGGSGKLFWSDEFNTDGAPDTTKWGYDIGGGGWGNGELEYYTSSSSNSIIANGALKITAIKQDVSGSNYTSARLITKNKFNFAYGRVDVRAKLPSSVGTWPAIWMLGSNIDAVSWPNCGEIDIMEQKGGDKSKVYGTIHYPGHSGGGGIGSTTSITGASSDFHVYSLDWSPATIKMYVDNQLYFSFANSSSVPFNHNFFCILNLAMGGSFGGSVDPNFTSDAMLVDYVRVYK